MQIAKRIISALFVLYSTICLGQEKSQWTFDMSYGGITFNIPAPLYIEQEGETDISIPFAKYRSEEYIRPWYWLWRFSKIKNSRSWGFEAIHHKLYLQNKTSDIQDFAISHGYNILHINRGFHYDKLTLMLSAGCIYAHPENTIRDKKLNPDQGILNWGYYITGPSIATTINKKWDLSNWIYFWAESKLNLSYSKVPIAKGNAKMVQASFHLMASLGVYFIKPKEKQ